MQDGTLSRRRLLKGTGVAVAAVSAGGWLLAGCQDGGDKKEAALDCTDLSELGQQQKQTRKSLNYVEESKEKGKQCDNCRYWQPPKKEGSCGTCQLVPGPIHPKGYCDSYTKAKS